MNSSELLSLFKSKERDNKLNLAAVAQRPALRLFLGAWSTVHAPFDGAAIVDVNGMSDAQKWKALWSARVKYDLDLIAVAIGVHPREADLLFRQAIALRLIYPDGTVSGPAAAVCQAYLLADTTRRKS